MNKFDNKLKGSTVFVKDNENINQALKRFKRKIEDSKVLETLRQKESYEKPTTIRTRKPTAAKARWKKQLRDQQLPQKMY